MRAIDGSQNMYVMGRKSKRVAQETASNCSKVSKVRASAWGVANYLPSYDPGENDNTMAEYQKLLLASKKEKNPDLTKVKSYMDKTFPQRRKLIVTNQETIKEVLEQNPWLESKTEFKDEFTRIVNKKKDITELIQTGLLNDYEGFLFLSKKKKLSAEMMALKNKMATTRDPAELNVFKAEYALHNLMMLMKENIEEIKGNLTENGPPVYILEAFKEESSDYHLICDGHTMSFVTEKLIDAFAMYVVSFYIFNLAYDGKSVKTVTFLLKRICRNK